MGTRGTPTSANARTLLSPAPCFPILLDVLTHSSIVTHILPLRFLCTHASFVAAEVLLLLVLHEAEFPFAQI